MLTDKLLQIHTKEHEALFQGILTELQADQRVVAAWLFGSRGRNAADIFSDLDLWVVVKDEAIETISAERQSYVAQVERPLLLLESPGNAPSGGAYLMALYPGQTGVHQIDWYWQRQADASLPRQALLLFNRGDIPQDTREAQLDPPGMPAPLTELERTQQITQLSTFFWAMSNIAVKSILRRQAWITVNHLEGLRSLVDSIKRLTGLSYVSEGQEVWRTTILPPIQRLEQIAMLRELAHEMEDMTEAIDPSGGSPFLSVISAVYTFFDLAATLIQQEEDNENVSHETFLTSLHDLSSIDDQNLSSDE